MSTKTCDWWNELMQLAEQGKALLVNEEIRANILSVVQQYDITEKIRQQPYFVPLENFLCGFGIEKKLNIPKCNEQFILELLASFHILSTYSNNNRLLLIDERARKGIDRLLEDEEAIGRLADRVF